jgi:hypothetical protein
MTKNTISRGAAASGLALSLLCGLHLSQAQGAEAKPAASDRHADFEGVWDPAGGPTFDPTARNRPENKGFPLTEWRDFPPYNAEYEARYARTVADIRRGVRVDDGSAKCLPQGMPRMMVIGYPIDIIVQPKRVVMMFETLSQRRVINMDGRKHSDPETRDPTFSGESIGHWEGDVLVVDTVGLREDLFFDYSVAPHSDALHIVERIRRIDDTLEDQMVLDDPKALTKPWQITRTFKLRPGWDLKEFVCENNQDNP